MVLIKPLFTKVLSETKRDDNLFRRNVLKDILQIFILDFIFSHKKYSDLIFYGGSCLVHCFSVPRLSEDLDFVDLKKNIDLAELSKDLAIFFEKETDLTPKIIVQPSRVKLKFPILKDLGLARPSDPQFLLLKIEVFKGFDYCLGYKTDVSSLFKLNRSVILKTFDLPTMMATKIGAVLHRKWEKIAKGGEVLATVKGRDYFDLVWYLNKGVKPNLKCIMGFKAGEDLKKELLKAVERVDKKSIKFDLEPLMEDKNFVANFSKNIKSILRREIEQKL